MRYASGCNVPSIKDPTGVFVLPFGCVSASEEMLNLLGVPSANCRTDNTRLYLNVFQKRFEFCGGNLPVLQNKCSAVLRTQNYIRMSIRSIARVVRGVSQKGPGMISKGTPSAVDVMCMDCESQKLMPTDVFQAYSALCSRGIRNTGPSTSLGGRNACGNSEVSLTTGETTCSRGIGGSPSLNVRQTTTVSNSYFIDENDVRNTGHSTLLAGRITRENREVGLKTGEATYLRGIRGRPSVNMRQTATVCTFNFIHDNDVRNTGPSILRGRKNTRVNPEVSLTTGEDTCSMGIGGCRSVNVCEATIFYGSNFIHNNDARNTNPSTSRGGRNTRVNLGVTLTTAEATCSSDINRCRSVRRRSSTRIPTVGSSSAASADSNQRFHHCGASFWYGERLKGHSHNQRSEYYLCCGRGGIYMQPPREPPEYIKSLFGNKHFMKNIWAYNQMFAMTSFGAKINESINASRGPYVFKVSGQIYHLIGSLCPPPGEAPRFLQLYIYDTGNEVENRMQHFSGIHNSDLDPQMVEGLIYFLDVYNELVQLFRTSRDKCRELDIPEFKIRLYNSQVARGYEFPASNTLGAMVFESGITSNTDFDVIIQHKDGPAQRVNKLHPSYMSLQFPFLFIYRQSGYHTNLMLRSADGRGKARRKIQSFVTFLKEERIYGNVTGVLYTVEFQKRGLPHGHTLLWVDSESKIKSIEDVDQYILAELPYPRIDPDGYNIVFETMMHGPYGAANMKASCMKGDKCGKSFPKKFNSKTFFEDNGHVHYQRRDISITTTRNQFKLDNNYVVSYNRDLLLAFRAHINVEYYGWSMLIKYLFKYISKGINRIFARVSRPMGESSTEATPSREMVDGIQNYVEGRFICAHEAYYRIFKFDIHHKDRLFKSWQCTWKMQRITFRDKDRLRSVVNLAGKKNTTSTEWFAYNASNETGRLLSYLEFPSEFVWHSDSKSWSPRRNNKSSIGHLAYVHPTSGELFFLRMLLCHQKGCRDFFEVQTINDVFYPTYRAACEALGLLGDDREWETALEEACAYATSEQLRFVFSHILLHCIASLLLPSGRTTHSRFKLPLELTEESLCRITKNTQLGKLLADTDLIIWDEAPMNDHVVFKHSIEASETSLTNRSLYLEANTTLEERSLVNSFAPWLLDIGDGKTGRPAEEDPKNTSWIDIPASYCLTPDEQGLSKLIDFIYDQSTLHTPSAMTLQQKAIVCPKNETADIINSKVLDMVPGEIEHLNTPKLPGFPPHHLELKVGAPVMLLRNVNLAKGLCNGTRMIVRQLMTKLIEVHIIMGKRVGRNGNIIELTLWDEMAKHFDHGDIKNMEQPVIIAVSSCRVSKYREIGTTSHAINAAYQKQLREIVILAWITAHNHAPSLGIHHKHDCNRHDHFLQSSGGQSGGPSMYRAGRKIQASRPEEYTTKDLSSTRKTGVFQFHLNTLGNLRDLTIDAVFDLKKQDESMGTTEQEPSKGPPSSASAATTQSMENKKKLKEEKKNELQKKKVNIKHIAYDFFVA
nr:DNA helicase [Tanacetum cinerariifolium]